MEAGPFPTSSKERARGETYSRRLRAQGPSESIAHRWRQCTLLAKSAEHPELQRGGAGSIGPGTASPHSPAPMSSIAVELTFWSASDIREREESLLASVVCTESSCATLTNPRSLASSIGV